MRETYLVEGESATICWQRLQMPFELVVGEQTLRVVHHRPGFCLLEDGRCLRYSTVSPAAGEWTLHWQGQPLHVKLQRGTRSQSEAGAAGGLVHSPMNGVVVKVLAAPGQAVQAGEVILVLEAMKMENEVTAPISGTLARCEVSAGQTVSANQFMFEVKA